MDLNCEKLENFLNKNYLRLSKKSTISEAVAKMIEEKSEYVVITDEEDKVVEGYITYQDIVKKITLLDKSDKLDSSVITIMEKEIKLFSLSRLLVQARQMIDQEKDYGFFFIGNTQEAKIENIVGILSYEKLMHYFIPEKAVASKSKEEAITRIVHLLQKDTEIEKKYTEILKSFGYKVEVNSDVKVGISEAILYNRPIIIDLDKTVNFSEPGVFQKILSHKGTSLFITSQQKVLVSFRKMLDSTHQHVFLKPLDFDVIKLVLKQ